MAAPFTILNSRKRALIALIHSVFFLALATRDLVISARLAGILDKTHVSAGSVALVSIYVIVSGVLFTLFGYSAGLLEKLYFAFCAASAGSGLVRAVVGDANFAAGAYLRVVMLVCAAGTGIILLRAQSAGSAPVLRSVEEES
jgi:hypothetical protein